METIIIILLIAAIALLIIILLKPAGNSSLIQLNDKINSMETSVRSEFSQNRTELGSNLRDSRTESAASIKNFGDSLSQSLGKLQEQVNNDAKSNRDELGKALHTFQESFSNTIKNLTDTFESRLKSLQEDNNQKLEKMRQTVDEKLQTTLEKRLSESFSLVSQRLELVHQSLGEMQNLAAGVGDIKKVLTNIKARGVLGEYQLENLLEQILTKEQYSKNVRTRSGSSSSVEFAVKLPGREDNSNPVWLPLDSKFPTEDYQNLIQAYDEGDKEKINLSKKNLMKRIKESARDIKDKYINPPDTTDFAIMFLPFEGLFAEVLNNAGFFESVQREFKIIITGPTTLSAFLNSLRIGFSTLAIEKRTSEVWEILGAVKTEFGRFGEILDRTKKKLQEASNTLDDASLRSRAIEKKLRNVNQISSEDDMTFLLEESSDKNQIEIFKPDISSEFPLSSQSNSDE